MIFGPMAPRPWQADFDFYITTASERSIAVLLDMNAIEHAPLETHPLRLTVRVRMKEPRGDGLRSREEAEPLFELEDRLISTVETTCGAIYVGRSVVAGYTYLVFYATEEPEVPFPRLAAVVTEAARDYPVGVTRERDEAWTFYRETLYPEEHQRLLMSNRRVVENFTKAGDDGTTARPIDHVAVFPSPTAAEAAAAELRAAGFETDETTPELDAPEGTTRLAFHRLDALAAGHMDDVTLAITDLLERHGGTYDGWGATIVTPPVAAN